ncbi:hypothetical protein BS329_38940, partial [Amycolatopsis coloradensis]
MTSTADLFNTDSVENALRDATPADDVTEAAAPESAGFGDDTADRNSKVVFLDPKKVAPHPFNAPSRSVADPKDPEYAKLKEDVSKQGGNRVPALVVTKAAFLTIRPNCADELEKLWPGYTHVGVYGARRRIVAIETRTPFKAELDDSVMQDDGDLVALATENKHRKSFSELDEALMYKKSIDAGVSQRQLVKILPGVSQPTISRRLALLMLVPEVKDAMLGRNKAFKDVNNNPKKLPGAEAAIIGGKLPYGEPDKTKRPTKKNLVVPETTRARYEAQLDALNRIHTKGDNATDACEYVTRKLAGLAEARKAKAKVVESAWKTIGVDYLSHRVTDSAALKKAAENKTLIAETSDRDGAISYYTTAKPKPKSTPKPTSTSTSTKPAPTAREDAAKQEAKREKEAREGRWEVLMKIAKKQPSADDLFALMCRQAHNGMGQTAGGGLGGGIAEKLCHQANIGPNFGNEWRAQMAANTDPAVDKIGAWVRALGAMEFTARQKERTWDGLDLAYFEILAKRGKHEPTEWEEERLAKARHKIEEAARAENPDDADEDADDADEPDEDADDADEDADDADDADDAEADTAEDADEADEDADDAEADTAEDADEADEDDADDAEADTAEDAD